MKRGPWFTVAVLTAANIFAFIDRQVLGLLIEPIRDDLAISDPEIGLLIGFAFAIFYTIFGLPLGRLVDVRSRKLVVAVSSYLCLMDTLNAIKQGAWQRVGGIHTIEAREGLTTKLREIGANAYNGGYVRRTLNRGRFQFWAYVYTLPPDGGPSIRRTRPGPLAS